MTLKKNSLAFITLMGLAGCATTPQIDQKNGCRLVSTPLGSVKNAHGRSINFKRQDAHRILSWVIFTPRSTENTPLNNPSIILKLYREETPLEEIRISKGYTHQYIDQKRLEKTIVQMGLPKEIINEPLDLDQPTDISSEEIWSRPMNKVTYSDLCEVACSFPLSRDEFQRIMKSDLLEILIQTHTQPIILKLDKENFVHLDHFQKKCFKD